MGKATLSGVVFTYNSTGPLLERVLKSIKWVDEIIVIDNDSRDKTSEMR